MLSFKYTPSDYKKAFIIEQFANTYTTKKPNNNNYDDDDNNDIDNTNIFKYNVIKNVDKIFNLYQNDKSLILIKKKCNIDIEKIFKSNIPMFKKYVNKITKIKTETDAVSFINNEEYYNIIKIISENIINLKKSNIKCIYKQGFDTANEDVKKKLINNAIDFNFTFTNDNLKIINDTIKKYSNILVSMIKWMIESLIQVYLKSGYDKEKLEIILKLKDMLLYSFLDENFILEQSNKSCDPKIDKIKTAMMEQNDINMKKYISDIKESCKEKCVTKIQNEKVNKISDSTKDCEKQKTIIKEEIERKNNKLKKEIVIIKEETTKINDVSNKFNMATMIFSILFIIFFYLYYKKK